VAKVHNYEFADRVECLDAFAESYGECPPVGDIPPWWEHFERWYQEQMKSSKDGIVSLTLRTETREYEDQEEDEDEDEPEDEEPSQ